jgi:LmbE family N-acetylglucosaminyl deacetylase
MRRSPRRGPDIGGDCVERWRRLPFLRYAPCHFSRGFLAQDLTVVVAHPDDETVGCGALLSRLSAVPVILVTDGAPRNLADARRLGFPDADSYARARLDEWRAALDIAAIPQNRLTVFGFPDQEAAANLVPLARQLADTFRRQRSHIIVTHAYEGGHPDHDAVAFAVHLAARLLEAVRHKLFIFEMPLYRLGDDGPVYQSFCPDIAPDIAIPLSPEEQDRKRRMVASFATQEAVLKLFSVDVERFRAAPAYRFPVLPNMGRLLYEQHDWGMTGERWQRLASAALEEVSGVAAQ